MNQYEASITKPDHQKSDILLFSDEFSREALGFRHITKGQYNVYDVVTTLFRTSNEFRSNPLPGMEIKNKWEPSYITEQLASLAQKLIIEDLEVGEEARQKKLNILEEYKKRI